MKRVFLGVFVQKNIVIKKCSPKSRNNHPQFVVDCFFLPMFNGLQLFSHESMYVFFRVTIGCTYCITRLRVFMGSEIVFIHHQYERQVSRFFMLYFFMALAFNTADLKT